MSFQCDIDEILRRAETRDEGPNMVGDELLSAFKVASFAAFDEDEPSPANVAPADDESKDWDEIIPERLRKKVEEEEKSKEIGDLYLPPRHRSSAQQQSESEGDAARRRRRERREEGSGASSEEEDSDDEKPKKRGRPPLANRERIKNFTDVEVI